MPHLIVLAVSLLFTGLALTASAPAQDSRVDPTLPSYERIAGIGGSLKSVGSDTLNQVMGHLSELYRRYYPNVTVEIEGKGSSTAPPALIEGQAQFGPMSRAMKPSELDAFEARFGYKPTPMKVGIDALAVFVHKDCPLEEITLEQIRRVFSVDAPELTWGDLGVTDPRYRTQRISLYGRNSVSGTYGYFKEVGLGGTDFKPSVKEQPGSSAVVQGVARDPYAMGYSGTGYVTPDVKSLRVAEDESMEAFEPSYEYAVSGDYPLARFLYVYVNYDARVGLDPLRREFVRMTFSREGQEAVVRGGYFPVPGKIALEQAQAFGISDFKLQEPGDK